MEVVETVKLYMDVNGMSQKEFSAKTNINQQVLSALLKGKRRMTDLYLSRLYSSGVLNMDKHPDIMNEDIKTAKAIHELKKASVDIQALADSVTHLTGKGIPATQIPKIIRKAA